MNSILTDKLRSPRYGQWQGRYLCAKCDIHSRWLHVMMPCPHCGDRHAYMTTMRKVTYSIPHRIALFLAREPQPINHWELKP